MFLVPGVLIVAAAPAGGQAFLAIDELDWWCRSRTTGVLTTQSPLAEQVGGVLAELEPAPGESVELAGAPVTQASTTRSSGKEDECLT
ncbi:MAG: hypothetical protein KY447_02565 [Actinobacteria bacterium]|nr:hypothetical protein [Actinomycetota bacterium]